MSGLRLRRAGVEDLQPIVTYNLALAFETEQLRLDPEVLKRGVEAVLRDRSKGFYLVAEQGARVVGQLMITFEWSDWRNADWWWLQSVYVAPDARRTGVFRALYASAVAEAKQAGAHGLRLYVERENTAAQKTYAALGMKEGRYKLFELGEE